MVHLNCLESDCNLVVDESNLLYHLYTGHDYSYDEAHQRMEEDSETSFFSGPSVDDFDDSFLINLYRKMVLIRQHEQKIMDLSQEGNTPGTPHPCIGQEGSAVGACATLNDDDLIASTHRGHGHLLAKGVSPRRMVAEIGGKKFGINNGRGGTMHMIDMAQGVMGQNAIVGAGASHLTGGVLQSQLEQKDLVGIAFFGEGAMNQGIIPEVMNLASIWDLPVLFVCENNQYQVTFSWRDSIANQSLPQRAEGYGVPGKTIDGQNVLTVFEEIKEAVDTARQGGGPYFIECQTYRYVGHFAGEDQLLGDVSYRSKEELDYWESKRDPIDTLADELEEADLLSQNQRENIDREIAEEMEEAVEFMHNSDHPSGEEVMGDVYAADSYDNFPAPSYR